MKKNSYTLTLKTVAPYINWIYFFKAWKLSGKYDGIESICDCGMCKTLWLRNFSEEERAKAEEALNLLRDAQQMLREMESRQLVQIKANVCFAPARSVESTIEIKNDTESVVIPTLRQQHPAADGFCYALSDFVSPLNDEVGLFAISVQGGAGSYESDTYQQMLFQTLTDRIVEAASEYLHHKLLKGKGIRPAIGYPSLPDQSLIFVMDKLLHMEQIGISITENGAMAPSASVCGLYIKLPKSFYFMVGKIDEAQLQWYASVRGKSVQEMKRWLIKNI